jgi:DNA-binding response OmpR family regulator
MRTRPLRAAIGTKRLIPASPSGSSKETHVSARKRTVLIADPATDTFNAISGQLDADGFTMQHAVDGTTALATLKHLEPDLMVLDLQLATSSGLDLLREIRRVSDVPTIVVSDRAGETDRIVALELGADDFLGKPCSSRELLARIGALVRRSSCECGSIRSLESSRRAHDAITIDRGRHQVLRGNDIVKLTATEFRILDALASNADHTLTRSQVLDLVTHDSPVFDRTLDKHVANLRKKIERDASHPRHLITIFGVGYRFRS